MSDFPDAFLDAIAALFEPTRPDVPSWPGGPTEPTLLGPELDARTPD